MTATEIATVSVWLFRDGADTVFRFELPAGSLAPCDALRVATRVFGPVSGAAAAGGPCLSVRCPGHDLMPARVVADMLADAGFTLGGAGAGFLTR